jgi:hypothetical protein
MTSKLYLNDLGDGEADLQVNSNRVVQYSTTNGVGISSGKLFTDLVTPKDLTIDCGTQKTIVLAQPVWDDCVVPMTGVRLGGANPAAEIAYRGGLATEFVDNATTYVYMNFQLPHSYYEGSDVELHLHWTINGNGSAGGAENIKWIATSSTSSPTAAASESWPVETVHTGVTVDVQNNSQHDHIITDIAEISGTGLKASEVIIVSIRRDHTVTDNATLHALIVSADLHFQKDTMGSRTEYLK